MTLNIFDLKGKVAVVTGGYKGIGRGIAEGLASAGANLIIAARNFEGCEKAAAEINRDFGVKTMPVRCDVSRVEDAENMIAATVEKFGQVDILANNAGITGSAKAMVDIPDEEWQQTLSINLTGIFNCSRAAAREMIKRKNGKIINVTSVASFMPVPHSGDYCASKGGALLLTKVMALELIKYNIQVNAICPGYFDTDLNPGLASKVEQEVKKRIPARRIGNPKEIAGLAVLLASPAGDYLVGAAINIDGGVMLR
ncbi:MAG: 3-oxoacyl-ACP reductase FabG [Desulfobacteraceae bacterium]|nr:MAG: 3-oxoacyl-ACP reductase FabG [Desulfobacteraceae bacterium]